MHHKKATADLILYDFYSPKKNDKYPVKIRITFNRARRYYGTGIDLSAEEWSQVFSSKPGNLSSIRDELVEMQTKARNTITGMPVFNWAVFVDKFYGKGTDNTLAGLLKQYEDELKMKGNIGNMKVTHTSRLSLEEFGEVKLNDISPELLNRYEKWMLGNGKKLTTVGVYLRSWRTVINIAIEKGLIKREQYPFGKRKYIIPKGSRRNERMLISKQELTKIEKHKTDNAFLQRDIAFLLFSYYGFGVNYRDILFLRNREIQDDVIIKIRTKTSNSTRSDPRPLVIPLNAKMKAIIKQFGSGDKGPDDLVFPICKGINDPERLHTLCTNFISDADKRLKKLGIELGIKASLTTYVVRHSFATRLVPIIGKEMASELLGHRDKRTIENYWTGHNKEALRKIQKKL